MDESEIVKAIGHGFGDLASIHVVTGIPIPCIERKLYTLVAMGLVTEVNGVYKPCGDATTSPFTRSPVEKGSGAIQGIVDDKERYVLVVDDEPDIRLFIRLILEKHGYKVLEASNA
ncbi:MAG: response regulator, partial [Candidatus Lokiarchaeota archaeon]|nr:response regulator [Candidatus Lokiarchaeota archaeon]